uniref:Uncharacterized protein n=1 Tax=Ralstonia syzygii R24 TaxID=907261 RepID=G3AAP7_9RALS|nr:hypothetical protein RALSY_mp30790 [Ralstonia syzygii R24]
MSVLYLFCKYPDSIIFSNRLYQSFLGWHFVTGNASGTDFQPHGRHACVMAIASDQANSAR